MRSFAIFFLRAIFLAAACLYAASVAESQELRVPEQASAGTAITLQTSGSGKATFYLAGPSTAIKRDVKLGEEIKLPADELRSAGLYIAVLKADNTVTRTFFVGAAQPASLNFLARPSRVPVARPGVISGVAFVFDDYKNLVTQPATVNFNLSVGDAPALTRAVPTHDGIAWTRLDSSKREGAAQFIASLGSNATGSSASASDNSSPSEPASAATASVRRVVQQTASDPCNLRFRVQPSKLGIEVETDPVRDCTGNAVPDGTIVTFTENDGKTRSTVDARIKRGVARAELPAAPGATISVASGVVLGNEIRWGGGR
jgi:hypothetical protein